MILTEPTERFVPFEREATDRLCTAFHGSVPHRIDRTLTGQFPTCSAFCKTQYGMSCRGTSWSKTNDAPREGCDDHMSNETATMIDAGSEFYCCCIEASLQPPESQSEAEVLAIASAAAAAARASASDAAAAVSRPTMQDMVQLDRGYYDSLLKIQNEWHRMRANNDTLFASRGSSSDPLEGLHVPSIPKSMRHDKCLIHMPLGCHPVERFPDTASATLPLYEWREVTNLTATTSDNRARECLGQIKTTNEAYCRAPLLVKYCTPTVCFDQIPCIDDPTAPGCHHEDDI